MLKIYLTKDEFEKANKFAENGTTEKFIHRNGKRRITFWFDGKLYNFQLGSENLDNFLHDFKHSRKMFKIISFYNCKNLGIDEYKDFLDVKDLKSLNSYVRHFEQLSNHFQLKIFTLINVCRFSFITAIIYCQNGLSEITNQRKYRILFFNK